MTHPDTTTPTGLAQQAINLLAAPTDTNLRQARDLLTQAAATVPYLADAAPNCYQFRIAAKARYCLSAQICGRCRPLLDAADN